jgi:regulator of sigma E protease
LLIARNGATQTLNVEINKEGKLGFKDGRSGIAIKPDEPLTKTANYTIVSALPKGASRAWGMFSDNAKGLGKVFKGEVEI